MANMVYALVVGIDEYPDPQHRLAGCVNDAQAVASFLQSQVPAQHLSLKTMLNAEVSRQALIDAFRQHLGQAGLSDTAFFFYAGHGSQERAPEMFWTIEPDRLDETLVCHDSRTPGGWDLADKEIALLLGELGAKQPHIAVVLDCCHSGSGTRAAHWSDVVRRFPTDSRDRPLDAFLPGVIEAARRTVSGDSGWDTPDTGRHVLLAACRDDQEAKEYSAGTQRRGAFTWFLLEALQTGGSGVTYREAYKRARALLEVNVAAQTPQIEASDDADLDRPFLGGKVRSQQGIYTVRRRADGAWTIDAGRVHGFAPPQGSERTDLAVFDFAATPAAMSSVSNAVARAHVTAVQSGDSVIELNEGTLAAGATYRAVVTGLPLPLSRVRFSGDGAGIALLQSAMASASPTGGPSTYIVEVASGEDVHVNVTDGRYEMRRASDSRPIAEPVSGVSADAAQRVIRALEHVARWSRVVALENPASRLAASDVSLELYAASSPDPIRQSEIELSYQRDASGKLASATFRVKLRNHGERTLYCGLIGLSQMYGVDNLFPEGTLRLEPGQEAWVNGGKSLYARIPKRLVAQGVTECTDILKLIVTTTEFDVRLLAQPDIDQPYTRSATRAPQTRKGTLNRMLERVHTRALSSEPDADEEIDDFLTTALTIRTVRPRDGAQVNDATPVTLDANVVIAPHAAFRGLARLTTIGNVGRDIGAHVEPPIFRDQTGVVVPLQLTGARGTDEGLSALELLDLVRPESVTPEAPLRVSLPVSLQENEAVLPLAHDGEFFLPVGHAMKTDSGVVLDIVRLPTEVQGRRSLTSAIRIVFHKLVLRPLGVRYKYPLLACVDLGPDGKVQYDADSDSIRRRVAGASRIVLFVHGIIGDTTLMAGCIAARGLDELVMAFDYENLHTTIEANAELLRDRLADVGLTKGHVKDFQIVAHSMGGLVSRWFIEQLGGKEIVKHLVMAGTPNAGSPWPTVQEWASTAAALAVNGLTTIAWPVQAIGWVLAGVERIDNALDEMTPGCPFLTQLAALPDPHVPYTIIAGNTSIPPAVVVNGNDSRLTRLLRKLSPRGALHKGLTLALFGQPNDIAVTVTSINEVGGNRHPAPVVHETACDHVTYFTHAASLDLLRAALNWGTGAGASVSSGAPL